MTEPFEYRVKNCKECKLHEGRNRAVIYKGSNNPKVMFIGEAPGAEEDKEGIPFVGRSGKLLDKWIEYLNLDKSEYGVANICKCRPPMNRAPTEEERKTCLPFLREQIKKLKPNIVVVLGKTAFHTLVPRKQGLLYHVGKFYNGEFRNIFVMIHPSYKLRNQRFDEYAPLSELKKWLGKYEFNTKPEGENREGTQGNK